jgi:hypothetical protein
VQISSELSVSRIAAALLTALPTAWALPAAAQISGATTYYEGQTQTINIPVYASIGTRCGFASGGAPSGNENVGAVDNPTWTKNFPFELECTGPSNVAVVSTNGGLVNGSPPGIPGYTNVAPYDVKLHLVGDSSTTAEQTCAVSTLTASAGSPCTFRGPASSTVGLNMPAQSLNLTGSYLEAKATALGSDILVEGTYSDTLTVTVSAAI